MDRLIQVRSTPTLEDNIVIAKYMGYREDVYDHNINGKERILSIGKSGDYKGLDELHYNSDWNELVPVIRKLVTEGLLFITADEINLGIKKVFEVVAWTIREYQAGRVKPLKDIVT